MDSTVDAGGGRDRGFYIRDIIRFFIVDIILIAAVRLLLALGFFSSADNYVLALLGSKLVLFFYLVWLIRDRRDAWQQTGATRFGKWWMWLVCILLYCAYLPLASGVDALNEFIMVRLHSWLGWQYERMPQEVVVLIFEDVLHLPARIVLIFFTVLAGPCMEELAFRGMGLDAYRRASGAGWAIVMTSLLFGAYHFSLQFLFSLSFLGVLFAVARLWSGSLWCSVFLHCIHNGLSLALTAHYFHIIQLPLVEWFA